MKLLPIGFGNYVAAERIISITGPDSAPVKRMIQDVRENGMLIDASFGRSTRAVLSMDSGHVILSSISPDVLATRLGEKPQEEVPGDIH